MDFQTIVRCSGCQKPIPEGTICPHCHTDNPKKPVKPKDQPAVTNHDLQPQLTPEIPTCSECLGIKSTNALWCPHCGSIRFWRMVVFLVYVALASVPALIITIGIVAGSLSWLGILFRK